MIESKLNNMSVKEFEEFSRGRCSFNKNDFEFGFVYGHIPGPGKTYYFYNNKKDQLSSIRWSRRYPNQLHVNAYGRLFRKSLSSEMMQYPTIYSLVPFSKRYYAMVHHSEEMLIALHMKMKLFGITNYKILQDPNPEHEHVSYFEFDSDGDEAQFLFYFHPVINRVLDYPVVRTQMSTCIAYHIQHKSFKPIILKHDNFQEIDLAN